MVNVGSLPGLHPGRIDHLKFHRSSNAEMHDWCCEHVAAGAWAQHGHSERRKGEAAIDYARFYFMDEADAEAFRRRWMR